MKHEMLVMKMKPSGTGVGGMSLSNGTNHAHTNGNHHGSQDNHHTIPHNSCFLVNGKERKLSNSYLRFQRRYSKHGTRDAIFDPKDGSVQMHLRGKPIQFFAPSDTKNSYSLFESQHSKLAKLPDMKLEWVYGYRGKDARSNLYLLPTGELIYFVASIVVLFNPELNKQRHYLGHTEEVKCLAIHPNKLLIATGQATSGQDRKENKPHVRLWNSASLQTQCIIGIGEFERSVVCLSFSKDGTSNLVAVDEGSDHTMTVWDYQGQHGVKMAEVKCSNKETVISAEFHPMDPGLIVTCGKGHVNFWHLDDDLMKGELNFIRKTGVFDGTLQDRPKYVTCLAFASNGDVLTGDSNGNVLVWRRGYNAVTKSLKKVHNGPVFAICVLKDGSVVTGGGKDGKLIHFDGNYKKSDLEAEICEEFGSIRTICQGKSNENLIVGTTHNCILTGDFLIGMETVLAHGHENDIRTLLSPFNGQFLSLSHDKWIRMWDVKKHCVVWNYYAGDVPNACCVSNDGNLILVGMQNGCWKIVDIETMLTIDENHDLNDSISDIQFSPNGLSLAVSTKSGIIHLYQVSNDAKKYNRIGRCTEDGKKHRSSSTGSPINFVSQTYSNMALDWSSDSSYIRSNSQEASLSYWNATTCRQINNHASMRDVQWKTQNCLMTFETIGIWPETVDGTDLVVGAKSLSENQFVAGDDFGKLKLYNYPVIKPKIQQVKYRKNGVNFLDLEGQKYDTAQAQHSIHGGHSCPISALTFSSGDSQLLSAGGKDTAIIQWKLS